MAWAVWAATTPSPARLWADGKKLAMNTAGTETMSVCSQCRARLTDSRRKRELTWPIIPPTGKIA